jgi:hypothetical protein
MGYNSKTCGTRFEEAVTAAVEDLDTLGLSTKEKLELYRVIRKQGHYLITFAEQLHEDIYKGS